jgi:hypothetical protein
MEQSQAWRPAGWGFLECPYAGVKGFCDGMRKCFNPRFPFANGRLGCLMVLFSFIFDSFMEPRLFSKRSKHRERKRVRITKQEVSQESANVATLGDADVCLPSLSW